MKFVCALIVLLLGTALAVREDWVKVERAPASALVTLRFALPQRNLDILEKTLLDVSDIHSPNYGKWWSVEKIQQLVSPPASVSEAVIQFLHANHITNIVNLHDSLKVTAPVSQVEDLLDVTLFVFNHKTKKSKQIIRAVNEYEMPLAIAHHVEFIAGLLEFPTLRNQAVHISADSANGYIIPQTLFDIYQIPTTFPVNKNSSLCLAEFENDQSFSKTDLKEFVKETTITDINVAHIVGPYAPQNPDGESTLDVQFGGGVAQNTTVWFWTEKGWMLDFAMDLMAAKTAPWVVSMSWGWPEPLQCGETVNCTGSETSYTYVERTNVEFQKIGLRGITLLAASGDTGAPGDGNPYCSTAPGNGSALSSIFPGASPWVISVGATMLANISSSNTTNGTIPICNQYECATVTSELVCAWPAALITTGGGFSNYVPVPSYQSTYVSNYLKSGVKLPNTADFNATNRGFPDVAALGHNYLIYWAGQWTPVDGTSCSTPVWGAIISLLNSYRLNHGKPTLGFATPLLYQAYASDPTIFTDITSGNNYCTEECCFSEGFEATKGWDPVTGLGTPIFPKLLKFVESLP